MLPEGALSPSNSMTFARFSRYYDLNHCRIMRIIAKLDADWRTFRAPFRGDFGSKPALKPE